MTTSSRVRRSSQDPYNAQRFQDAIAMFDYGFKQMSQLLTVQDLVDMGMPVSFPVQVQNAAKNDRTWAPLIPSLRCMSRTSP